MRENAQAAHSYGFSKGSRRVISLVVEGSLNSPTVAIFEWDAQLPLQRDVGQDTRVEELLGLPNCEFRINTELVLTELQRMRSKSLATAFQFDSQGLTFVRTPKTAAEWPVVLPRLKTTLMLLPDVSDVEFALSADDRWGMM